MRIHLLVCRLVPAFVILCIQPALKTSASLSLNFRAPIQPGSYYEESGIAFMNVYHTYILPPAGDSGSLYFDSTSAMWALDGSLFQPVSVTLDSDPASSGGPYDAIFTGHRVDGSTIEQRFSVDHLNGSYSFDESFGYVSSLSINAPMVVANDAFTINVVPESSTIALFILGVCVLYLSKSFTGVQNENSI